MANEEILNLCEAMRNYGISVEDAINAMQLFSVAIKDTQDLLRPETCDITETPK